MRLVAAASVAALITIIGCSQDSASPTTPSTIETAAPSAVQTMSIVVDNPPCIMNGLMPSCTFRAVPSTNTTSAGYIYSWRFTNPGNGRNVQVTPADLARPPMDCIFLPNVGTTNIEVSVTASVANVARATGASTVQITRNPGTC